MNYSILYKKPSISLFIKTWLVEQLYYFKGKLYKTLVNDLETDFKKYDLIFQKKANAVSSLSASNAQHKLSLLPKSLKSFEKLDLLVSETKHKPLIDSFSSLKKSLYKYEAKLRRVANSQTDFIETPDDIKLSIYNRTKQTLTIS